MQSASSSESFFVKIEGQCHSNHRNPQGVYQVDVIKEKSLVHSACAAIRVAKEAVPFLDENPHSFTFRAFDSEGREVVVPRLLHTVHELNGRFRGRSFDHPVDITVQ